jgi:hydroxymethylbilane synthase
MSLTARLSIGTRGSPLALAQAEDVRRRLSAAHPELGDEGAIEISVIKTSGDKMLDQPLADIGGKGLFTKEIDEAMLDGRIDLAVHSMKDVPTVLPQGISMGAVLEREDPRDAFISKKAEDLSGLPAGSLVGTASLRRKAQVLNLRPDLRVVMFRGNVQTRLRKLEEGQADATLLAIAGLNRLSLADVATSVISSEDMLPAVAQGAVGVACRTDDAEAHRLLDPLRHLETEQRIAAERTFLLVLDGSCRTPIAALSDVESGATMRLRGLIAKPDGSEVLTVERSGKLVEAEAIGRSAGEELLGRAGPGFLAEGL